MESSEDVTALISRTANMGIKSGRPDRSLALRNSNFDPDPEERSGLIESMRRFLVSGRRNAPKPEVVISVEGAEGVPMATDEPEEKVFQAFKEVPGVLLPTVDLQYDMDIINYMYSYQVTSPASLFTSDNAPLNARERNQAVQFMGQVLARENHPLETFHLAVYVLDCMLEKRVFTREDAEISALAACSVAMKYERQIRLDSDFLGGHDCKKFYSVERRALVATNFELGRSGVIHLMRVQQPSLLEMSYKEARVWDACKVLSQLAVADAAVVAGRPSSLIAASVLRFTAHIYKIEWNTSNTLNSQHSESELLSCARSLHSAVQKALGNPSKNQLLTANKTVSHTWADVKNQLEMCQSHPWM